MSSGESLPESVSTGEPAPESGEPLPESFDLGASKIAPDEFPNRAWVYLKKLHDGKEQSFQQERNSLLETLTALSRDAEALAAEMGLLAYEIIRAAERQKKRGVEGEELTHLKTKLDNAMKKLNVRIENPLGEQLRDELLDHCEVIRNIPQPGTIGHIVGETITPIVIYQRKVVHRAEVIGWLGEQQNSQV